MEDLFPFNLLIRLIYDDKSGGTAILTCIIDTICWCLIIFILFFSFSFNNNRPPDYPPTLPPAPSLPHHSTQQPWHQQHSNQSFPSPGHSGGGGVHHDYYPSPTSTNNPTFPPMSASMTAHERNNNEPSMVSPSRYTGGGMHAGETSRNDSMPPGIGNYLNRATFDLI